MLSIAEAVRLVCGRTSMYVGSESYEAVVAFLGGFDFARDGGPLGGFREWLVVRVDGGNNLVWEQLVLLAAFPEQAWAERGTFSDEANKSAIAALERLLLEFLAVREESGLRRIYLDHENWLRRQDWYAPDWPDWYEFDGDS